ncbi:universal stress protein [Sphingorhabdus soli]|uniref:Universal stress protein n=1 Tax=Flavisphingopyxis soli TaxID=2601267 RepID=A0A5C6U9T5_9SPHN|nr:universal stress protein [Sphingorhabdus soli]TXC69260.1 universal stress protein [Sphingorhabdus soli]
MKSVLLHVQDDDTLEQRLQAALAVTRATGGHLSCIHVTPTSAYVAFDGFGGIFVMSDIITALAHSEDAIRRKVEDRLAGEDVPWDYEQVTGEPVHVIVQRAALADILVSGRDNPHGTTARTPIRLLGDILQKARIPLLLPTKDGDPPDFNGTALIAWDGSYESANAVRQSLPLLKLADDIRAIQIEKQDDGRFPSIALMEYLSRHDVSAELQVVARGSNPLGETIVDEARRIGAAYVVMGGYGHSRAGEAVFGGVTHDFLKDCPVPLVIAH